MRLLITTILAFIMVGQAAADDFIVIVYDSSGSMGERMDGGKTRMETAQDALVEVVSQVPDNTRIGLLTFDGWAYDLQKVNRALFTNAVRKIRPGGGTPLYEYVRAGATRLLVEREKQLNKGTYRLVIVTDGAAGDDNLNINDTFRDGTQKLGVMNDIARRNISVDAIGLDMQGDHAISRIIAEKNLGTYMQGNDPKSLTASLKQAVVAEVMQGKDTTEDVFKELDELPDEFFLVAVKGLTTNQNHPIGEKPQLIEVNSNGSVVFSPDPMNEPTPELGEDKIGGIAIFIIIGVIVSIIVLSIAIKIGS